MRRGWEVGKTRSRRRWNDIGTWGRRGWQAGEMSRYPREVDGGTLKAMVDIGMWGSLD